MPSSRRNRRSSDSSATMRRRHRGRVGGRATEGARPKRTRTAYCLFVRSKFQSEMRRLRTKDVTVVTRKLADLWNKLSDSKKRKYKTLEARDRRRYRAELALWGKKFGGHPPKIHRRRTSSRSTMRPRSSYVFFVSERWSDTKRRHPNFDQRDVIRALAKSWREMSESEKRPFQKLADEDKKRQGRQIKGHQAVRTRRLYRKSGEKLAEKRLVRKSSKNVSRGRKTREISRKSQKDEKRTVKRRTRRSRKSAKGRVTKSKAQRKSTRSPVRRRRRSVQSAGVRRKSVNRQSTSVRRKSAGRQSASVRQKTVKRRPATVRQKTVNRAPRKTGRSKRRRGSAGRR